MTSENLSADDDPLPRHAEFERALVELSELTGAQPHNIPGDFERTVVGFYMNYEWDVHRIVREHQAGFLGRNCFICAYDGLAVVPTGDVLKAVREIGTDGCNYGIGNRAIVDWLGRTMKTYELRLTTVSDDTIKADLLAMPDDPEKLAQSMVEICPGLKADKLSTIVSGLLDRREIFLWWD
jgi:hypothetical protein